MPIQILASWLIKLIAPLALIGLIYGAGYLSGHRNGAAGVHEQWQRQQQAHNALLQKAKDEIQQLSADAETTNRHIEAIHHEHTQYIDSMRRAAADDLARRLRRDAGKTNCRAVPEAAPAARLGNAAETAAALVLSERVAHRLEQRHEQADRLTESLRACRAYVKSLEQFRK